MLETIQLIYKANHLGIYLWTDGQKLNSKFPKSFADKALIGELKEHKESIIEVLKHNEVTSGDLKLPVLLNAPNTSEYPLSFAQERLWFIEQFEQGTNAYHIPMLFELKDATDLSQLKSAIQQVVQRHEVLRTIFKETAGEYVQIVLDETLAINEYRSSEVVIEEQIEKDIKTPFNLQADHPIRVSFYFDENSTKLLINTHHIASDGWSADLMMREISALYNNETLPESTIQYKDFSLWQREYLQGQKLQEQIDYWQNKMDGYEPLNLPLDKSRPQQIDYIGDEVEFAIDEALSAKLRKLSEDQGCTPYITLLSGFFILMSKYTAQEDVTVGTPVANRHYNGIQNLIGFFVNSLTLREQINVNDDIRSFIQQVNTNLIEAQQHQDLPFEKVVELLKAGQDPSRHPVFQVTFSMQSLGGDSEDPVFSPIGIQEMHLIAKHDLSFFMDDSQDTIRGALNFATALFDRSTIEGMAEHYVRVLEQMANNQSMSIGDYSLLTPEEHQQIVIDWNQTSASYEDQLTIQQQFEAQADKSPEHTAVVFGEQQISYRELNEKANQLARNLTSTTSIDSETIIAVCMDRSIEMIVALLAILKSGGIYVPIDPAYPKDRLSFLLEDTQAKLILSQTHIIEQLEGLSNANVIDVNTTSLENQETSNLENDSSVNDTAYIIYTSGTTGKPKGVCVGHQSLSNLTQAQINEFNIEQGDNVIMFASPVFDASISEIFTTLLSGAALHVLTDETRKSPDSFINYLETQSINVATIPPVFLNTLELQELEALKTIVVAGEACPESLMIKWSKGRKLINAYGPTEATVCATMHDFSEGDSNLNIGTPIDNTICLILDQNGNPVPKGVVGEIHVGGVGLAKGYLNNPELTAQKFINNPLAVDMGQSKGSKLYKTGDLGRWLADGSIEYKGRNDFQVKVRGMRVELEEIEQALIDHPSIAQASVNARKSEDDSTQNLVAHYIPEEEKENAISWWPSTAEYYVYDRVLYGLMTSHETRNECYRTAIKQSVKGKVVLDIGTGPDVILSRICIEEGAEKVYAIEYLKETYLKAQETIREHGLEDKITLIHGDCREVELPEKVDVCVSELVGAIGGSEGVAVLLNDAQKRHLKPDGIFVPERSHTKMALVELPDALINTPLLGSVPHRYTEQIFDQVGYPFDLRLCLKGTTQEHLASSVDTFEDLVWKNGSLNDPNHTHPIRMSITKDATIYGCLVWMDLITIEGHSIDILEDQHSWIPVYLPLFPEGVKVTKGDYIEGSVKRFLCENELNCDYTVSGQLIQKGGAIDFSYNSTHYSNSYKKNAFYNRFFELYENHDDYSLNRLDTFLRNQLPEHFIPDAFVKMNEFPFTINGKLDRKALPAPNFIDESNFVEPTTELEIKLAEVWKEVLNLEKIGINDDFFRIGGDSILSIQLSSKLRAHDLHCSMKVIFEHRTIERLARYLNAQSDLQEIKAEQGTLEGTFDLLPVQEWFFDKLEKQQIPAFNHWNQSFIVKVPELKLDKISSVVEKLIAHHDILRISYKGRQQTYQTELTPNIEYLNISGLSNEAIEQELTSWQSHFDIHNGPLWSIGYLDGYGDQSARLCFAFHHLIVDTVSWRILIDDFKAIYNNQTLEAKTSSYRQWTQEVKTYAENNPDEKGYWWSIIDSIPSYSPENKANAQASIELTEASTKALLQKANEAYQTEVNDLLLTALGMTLRDWNDSSIQGITLEGHGRESINDAIDHSKTVGWFTSMYPVQLELKENLEASIKSVKEGLRTIPNKGIGFGAFYPKEQINLPKISFNYMGQFDAQSDFWQVVPESSGMAVHPENVEHNTISINGLIVEGRLSFSISTLLGEEETLAFAANFIRNLEEVIRHCSQKEDVQHTPSDFESVSISQSLLDKIQNI